jgi:signal transduction histidine kinase
VPCDHAAMTFYNEEDDTFTVETVYDFAVRDWSELPAGYRAPAIHTPWQTTCRTATPLVQSELSRSAFAHDRTLADSGLRSGAIVPIVGGNRAIGTLDFASRDQGAYGQTQVATLLELSHYLGTVLHNARLAREREEAATKLARTQEHLNLVDKVRAVGQLASGVAHDFNNLLAGILGNAQLLLYEVRNEEQRSLLRIIEQASKDGAETVRRLQGFARMEHDMPMTEVRLDILARDAIDLTRPRWRDVAQSRGARIEIDRRLQPVTPLAGRPGELREVLTNLIINAVDALPSGGKITVATYDSRNDGNGAEDVVAEVIDTGTGMSPEVRSRIFDPFFTTKGEHGTGLGLAVSLGIIQSHGGQIEVESEAGSGTRFAIRLPVRAAEHAAKSSQRKPAEIIPGHILFVESEAMIRDATVRLLTRWGHRVTQASSGVEALERFLPDMYDVVISDLGMPDMNGLELLQQIKQRDHRVPTVLITGWGRELSDEEAHARSVDYVLEKPFDQDDLRAALAEVMGPK